MVGLVALPYMCTTHHHATLRLTTIQDMDCCIIYNYFILTTLGLASRCPISVLLAPKKKAALS